ncbi:MAG: zinc ribbon domain-containing protein [Clostridiaceae bacterium]|nr:zinc ribbon domain-containing protein [Eubacteriales bacterium]
MKAKFCQSCGMPMGDTDEMFGNEKDGSKSDDYCTYCYQNGTFTYDGNMEGMIEFCVQPMLDSDPTMTETQARGLMNGFLPTLKRWKTA